MSRGHEIRVRDLYAMGFDPVLKVSDFEALSKGTAAPDVKEEQDHIRWADVLTVVSPVWWFSLPSILKGYIDRVFSYGFAYAVNENGLTGLLAGKKVFIFNTTGGPEQGYIPTGMKNSMKQTIEYGIFEFSGMEMIGHKFLFGVPTADDAARKAMLADVAITAEKI